VRNLILIFSAVFISSLQPAAAEQSWLDAYKTQCPAQWDQQQCLSVVSSITKLMVQDYADTLNKSGHKAAIDPLTQECAAATAAAEGEYPAEAMRSAFTVCANYLATMAEKTQLTPNQDAYQILVGSILCLSGDPRCAAIEAQLVQ